MPKHKEQSKNFNQIKNKFVHGKFNIERLEECLLNGEITDDEYEIIMQKCSNKRRKK